jgi:uncharacterized membrane protein
MAESDDLQARLAELNLDDAEPPLDAPEGSDGSRRPARHNPGLYLSGGAFLATNVLLLSGHRVAFVGAALGWWLIVIHPTYQLCATRIWNKLAGAERVAYCLGAVLLTLMIGGLVLDVLLPHIGVPRPLAQRPILIGVDVLNIGLMAWRIQKGSTGPSIRPGLGSLRRWEIRILVAAASSIVLVVAGANRLNNGEGNLVALVGLSAVVVTFAFVIWRRDILRDSVIAGATYLLSLSLLLATSLRGWYITGHDIQSEYRVFQLAKDNGVWNIGTYHNAYNACLSITILPTEIWQAVRVDDPYIYKVFFQLLFAVVPVLVYLLARRYWSKQVAILGVIYFVAFPTFFTDMPYLNRQEIAFLYVGLAFLAMTKRRWSVWRRRIVMVICAIGVGLSHYSTMYVFVATLAIGLVAEYGYLLAARVHTRFKQKHEHKHEQKRDSGVTWADTARTITLGVVLAAGLVSFLWGDVITHTSSSVVTTLEDALPSAGGSHSVDASYNLFGGGGPSSQSLLAKYEKQSLHVRKKEGEGNFLPLTKVDSPIKALNTASLPLTRVGRLLADAHLPPATINGVVRGLASKGEQVFIGLGLVTVGFVAWRRRQLGRDFYFLGWASVIMVGVITVLPGLSVSYGLLRALQQALILVAPILVIGSFVIFKPFGRIWSKRLATVLALVFMISTIGVMPQLLGGYPAQLSLNNSGVYYNDYYTHPQDTEALQWLGEQPGTRPGGVQAENVVDNFFFTAPNEIDPKQSVSDIYPTLIQKSSWVLLGYSTVRNDLATAGVSGDLIAYRYPFQILSENKNLVFNNGSTQIYK